MPMCCRTIVQGEVRKMGRGRILEMQYLQEEEVDGDGEDRGNILGDGIYICASRLSARFLHLSELVGGWGSRDYIPAGRK